MLDCYLVTRIKYQQAEKDRLAPYAVLSSDDPGRKFPEPEHEYRTCFQRDRDRVLHCASFRRLEAKTQVFGDGTGRDYFRTRLTHSMEVSQIARTLARALGVNEDLTEATCLAHDLGHPPYGHCGEAVLNELMQGYGGFEHNSQSLRVVDYLEHPYPNFRGLNLCYETRYCLACHETRYDNPERKSEFGNGLGSVEGQIADLADSIAYDSHDLDDSLAAGLIAEEQLADIAIYRDVRAIVAELYPDAHQIARQLRCAKTIIDIMVNDALAESEKNLAQLKPLTIDDVKNASRKVVAISDYRRSQMKELENFLFEYVYKHPVIAQARSSASQEIGLLFDQYTKHPELMPRRFRDRLEELPLQRVVCDYISGMTDRYCKDNYRKIKDTGC
ncbi:MAG: deoxyguanosinetriphosphate triphosphohydrolase [Sedimentisphaerales bacterium]|nr:deoxyguanosinetriphosphate triphosphohydrolase [Sedimentisphaerales bacterium]